MRPGLPWAVSGIGRLLGTSHCLHLPYLFTSHALLTCTQEPASDSRNAAEHAPGSKVSYEIDAHGRERLALRLDGWDTWKWNGHSINYLSAGGGMGEETMWLGYTVHTVSHDHPNDLVMSAL